MEQIKKKRIKYFMLFLMALSIYITAIILTFTVIPLGIDAKLSIVLVLSIVFGGVSFWFRPRIIYYATIYSWFRLKENSEGVFRIQKGLAGPAFLLSLKEKSFHLYKDTNNYYLSYRYLKEYRNLALKRGSLEVVVFIKNADVDFQNSGVSKVINEVEDILRTEKKRFLNYVIIQIRLVNKITDALIEEADQIVFDKHGHVRVSLINVLLEKETNKLYYLHNKNYTPNFHYAYAIKILESLYE